MACAVFSWVKLSMLRMFLLLSESLGGDPDRNLWLWRDNRQKFVLEQLRSTVITILVSLN